MSEFGSNLEANRLFCAWRQTREIRRILCRTRALRFASSAQAPRHAGIFPSLQIVGRHYRLLGGEGGIRTPETLSSLHAFQACALNRARPPLRANRDYASQKPAGPHAYLVTLDRACPRRLKKSSGASRINGSLRRKGLKNAASADLRLFRNQVPDSVRRVERLCIP